jgi:hypothetical protein
LSYRPRRRAAGAAGNGADTPYNAADDPAIAVAAFQIVIAGLDPAIHRVLGKKGHFTKMDGCPD